MWTCPEVCESLTFLLDNIFVRYGNAIYRQVIGISMGTNCAPLVADLFLYCYERDFMLSLSPDTRAGVISARNKTLRYLDDILNIDTFWEKGDPSEAPKTSKQQKTADSVSLSLFMSSTTALGYYVMNPVQH